MPSIFKNKTISFIIVSYKTKHYLEDCIKAIISSTTGEYEIILVENNSGENLDSLQDLSTDRIHIMYSDKNAGFGSGVNIGVTKAIGDWLCFINPDTRIQGDIHMISTITENTGIMGLALVDNNQKIQDYQYGKFPTPRSIITNTAKKSWQMPTEQTISTDWVSGGSLCIETALFRELGGFDEQFFMYYEDIDLCRRAKQIGRDVQWTQQITVWHQEGGSESNIRKTKERYYTAQRKYIVKWYGGFWNLLLMPIHLGLLMRLKSN
jgi:GT2 family glycosyltransferase